MRHDRQACVCGHPMYSHEHVGMPGVPLSQRFFGRCTQAWRHLEHGELPIFGERACACACYVASNRGRRGKDAVDDFHHGPASL